MSEKPLSERLRVHGSVMNENFRDWAIEVEALEAERDQLKEQNAENERWAARHKATKEEWGKQLTEAEAEVKRLEKELNISCWWEDQFASELESTETKVIVFRDALCRTEENEHRLEKIVTERNERIEHLEEMVRQQVNYGNDYADTITELEVELDQLKEQVQKYKMGEQNIEIACVYWKKRAEVAEDRLSKAQEQRDYIISVLRNIRNYVSVVDDYSPSVSIDSYSINEAIKKALGGESTPKGDAYEFALKGDAEK